MAKYLQRRCPRCDGHLGIVLRESGRTVSVQAINGHCVTCGYRLAWILIRGREAVRRIATARRLSHEDCVPARHEKGGSCSKTILVFTALASSFLWWRSRFKICRRCRSRIRRWASICHICGAECRHLGNMAFIACRN
jgi:hypothetical protein